MPSWVQIANLALRRLGADRIASLGEDSENARAVNDCYETVRDAVLRLHPWNCALVRAALAADAAPPPWGYARQFTLPADPYCLRVWRLEDPAIEYRVEGRRLLTDSGAPLRLLYIARIADPELFDATLTVALAAALAAEIAFRLTASRAAEEAMQAWFDRALLRARGADAQEGTPEPVNADELLGVRS